MIAASVTIVRPSRSSTSIETGLAPVINTGIAHREPGIGQVGAGVVRAPMACFQQAVVAIAEDLGVS